MFQQLMAHFGASVAAIQGNWVGASSDNLTAINMLTAGSAMTLEEAAKQTWTGRRARNHGFAQVHARGTPIGTPGRYVAVYVFFTR